jgi:hypothetical protein
MSTFDKRLIFENLILHITHMIYVHTTYHTCKSHVTSDVHPILHTRNPKSDILAGFSNPPFILTFANLVLQIAYMYVCNPESDILHIRITVYVIHAYRFCIACMYITHTQHINHRFCIACMYITHTQYTYYIHAKRTTHITHTQYRI